MSNTICEWNITGYLYFTKQYPVLIHLAVMMLLLLINHHGKNRYHLYCIWQYVLFLLVFLIGYSHTHTHTHTYSMVWHVPCAHEWIFVCYHNFIKHFLKSWNLFLSFVRPKSYLHTKNCQVWASHFLYIAQFNYLLFSPISEKLSNCSKMLKNCQNQLETGFHNHE